MQMSSVSKQYGPWSRWTVTRWPVSFGNLSRRNWSSHMLRYIRVHAEYGMMRRLWWWHYSCYLIRLKFRLIASITIWDCRIAMPPTIRWPLIVHMPFWNTMSVLSAPLSPQTSRESRVSRYRVAPFDSVLQCMVCLMQMLPCLSAALRRVQIEENVAVAEWHHS